MKNIRLIAVTALVLISIATVGSAAATYFADPAESVTASQKVESALDRLVRDGFVIDDVIPNQVRYVAPPTGDFAWGTVTYTLSLCHGEGGFCRQIDYAQVTAEVVYHADRGFKVGKVTTEQWTVES